MDEARDGEAPSIDALFDSTDREPAALLKLEVQAEATTVLAALLAPETTRYVAPPFVLETQRGKPLRWCSVALDGGGRTIGASARRSVTVAP